MLQPMSAPTHLLEPRTFRAFGPRDLSADRIPPLAALPADVLTDMRAVAAVLPFRVNSYVVEELIDWSRVPDDPIFQLAFPQPGMLAPGDLARMRALITRGAPAAEVEAAARTIQRNLNPHPAGQVDLNVPTVNGRRLAGLQHKYRETVLFFPRQGQTCHTYCSYCFRWPQFVGLDDLKFASDEAADLVGYLAEHPEVSNVLVTGGDPMVMRTAVMRRYLEPLLGASLPQLMSIRIGTKAPAWWPHRFLGDRDADDLLRLFEEVVAAGRHLAIMVHYSHPHELQTPAARAALARIRSTGAQVRCQAPLIRHVNDDPDAWADLWRLQVRLGAVPYYMFVERDTGAQRYFEVPLVRAHDIYRRALRQVSGLARTVRGPSMSTTEGKVVIDGVARVHDDDVFVLRFLQARDPSMVARPFFAKMSATATWFDDLEPAFETDRPFFRSSRHRALRIHRDRVRDDHELA